MSHPSTPCGTTALAITDNAPVSEAGKAAIAHQIADVFGECLQVLQRADKVRKATGIPLPREASELYRFLRPLQEVQS